MIKKTMSIFEETLLASALSDFSDVPPEEEIDYSFSERFEQKAGELIKKSRSKTWHRVNTTAKKLLIAAIITALLATSAMAIPEVREEVMKIFAHDTGTYYYFTADEDTVKSAKGDRTHLQHDLYPGRICAVKCDIQPRLRIF